MTDSLENIISKGFSTWSRNLNICIPLIINYIIQVVVMFLALVIWMLVLMGGSSPDDIISMTDDELVEFMSVSVMGNIPAVVVMVILVFIIMLLFQAYFFAGAVGMSQNATARGDTSISDMFNAGGQNFIHVFGANVLILLLDMAGIIFMVPGAVLVRNNIELAESGEFTAGILLLVIGFVLWMLYLLILNIVLSLAVFAVVIENVGAMDGIVEGYRFFMSNKLNVSIMWILVFVLSATVGFVSYIVANIIALAGSDSLNMAWSFGSQLVILATINPLIMVWWTRLYMVKTGKNIYIDELLTESWSK